MPLEKLNVKVINKILMNQIHYVVKWIIHHDHILSPQCKVGLTFEHQSMSFTALNAINRKEHSHMINSFRKSSWEKSKPIYNFVKSLSKVGIEKYTLNL
jgi:hypothetical protein